MKGKKKNYKKLFGKNYLLVKKYIDSKYYDTFDKVCNYYVSYWFDWIEFDIDILGEHSISIDK